jgi:hypothetical protein
VLQLPGLAWQHADLHTNNHPHLARGQQAGCLLDVRFCRHRVVILQKQHGYLDVGGQLELCHVDE